MPSPIRTLGTSIALTSTLTQVGAAQVVERACVLALWATYTRGGGSATGQLRLRVEFSPDTSGSRWFALPAFDGASFAAGSVNLYPESTQIAPSAAGQVRAVWPEILLRNACRWRVLAADVDGAAPGTLDALEVNCAEA